MTVGTPTLLAHAHTAALGLTNIPIPAMTVATVILLMSEILLVIVCSIARQSLILIFLQGQPVCVILTMFLILILPRDATTIVQAPYTLMIRGLLVYVILDMLM